MAHKWQCIQRIVNGLIPYLLLLSEKMDNDQINDMFCCSCLYFLICFFMTQIYPGITVYYVLFIATYLIQYFSSQGYLFKGSYQNWRKLPILWRKNPWVLCTFFYSNHLIWWTVGTFLHYNTSFNMMNWRNAPVDANISVSVNRRN